MDLSEFILLDVEQQSDAVFEAAIKVSERSDEKHLHIPYHLFSFYIERKYSREDGNLIDLVAFDLGNEILDLYVNNIDLKQLFR